MGVHALGDVSSTQSPVEESMVLVPRGILPNGRDGQDNMRLEEVVDKLEGGGRGEVVDSWMLYHVMESVLVEMKSLGAHRLSYLLL